MKKILFISLVALLYSCDNTSEPVYSKYQGQTQGTFYNITFENTNKLELKQDIDSVLNEFEDSWSTFRPNSIVSRINKTEENVVVDNHFIRVFDTAKAISELTDGYFDMTVAPLVNAWGFGFKQGEFPDSLAVDSLKKLVGMDKVSLQGNQIQKANANIMIDGSAIAKGYSVDLVGEFLTNKGISNFLVEIGGEIVAKGVNSKGNIWRVGVDKPIDDPAATHRELQSVIKLSNIALATSGNYRRFYIKNGKKYAHTINPKTGYPVEHNLLSATVLAENCMTADALATAMMSMGLEKAKAFVAKNPQVEIYLIFQNKDGSLDTFSTSGIQSLIEK